MKVCWEFYNLDDKLYNKNIKPELIIVYKVYIINSTNWPMYDEFSNLCFLYVLSP